MRRIKVGDIFALITPNTKQKRFFQFIAKDNSSLSSDVVRVFKAAYDPDYLPTISEIIEDDIESYMHTIIRWGIKLNIWEYFGNSPIIGSLDLIFRSSLDIGEHPGEIFVSKRWEVWGLNKPVQYVGKLPKKYYNAAIGDVSGPLRALEKIEERDYVGPYYPRYTLNK